MQKNPRINSKIINKNPVYNLLLNQTFVDIYYCNNIQLSQLLVKHPILSSVMINFNLKWDTKCLITWEELWHRL